MDQIPFFPKFIIYGPIIAGMFLYILSFGDKQQKAIIESLGEKTAKNAQLLFRYGGSVLVFIGIIQYLIKDL